MADYRRLEAGDPAPWFRQRSPANPSYNFDTAAGRYIVLCFFLTAGDGPGRSMLKILDEDRALFNDTDIAFFGVSADPADESENRVTDRMPGIRFFWDFDRGVSRLYGAAATDAKDSRAPMRRFWLVLNPNLDIRAVFPAKPEGGGRREVAAYLKALPPVDAYGPSALAAPVLHLPNVLEPDLCRTLIDLYERQGGEESGFMREVAGKTVAALDFGHKRRSDTMINDEALKTVLQQRVKRRVVPAVMKVHQFEITRMERYIVGCYSAETSGHFRPHRDNTTKGTAHRRFAMSVNLNEDFDGGELIFPEYGQRRYKPPPGGACIFSCSLLHMVTPMTRGKRYAFLPFLYDEAAADLREKNNAFLDEGVGAYRK